MNLDDKHPRAPLFFETGDGFIKWKSKRKCAHCGELTAWRHRPLAVQLCSRTCYEGYVAEKLKGEE